jgi:CBS domain-containing protein
MAATAQSIREVMTMEPVSVSPDATVAEAAQLMRDQHIGDVLLTRQGRITGIVTDRDIAVRAIASGRDPKTTTVQEICSGEIVTLSADASIDDAIRTMRERSIRRIPVVENEQAIGVVSLGDLAIERDATSVLGNISAAPSSDQM